MQELVLKWQSLYNQRQIAEQTMDQYTIAYIIQKLLPMWSPDWMTTSEIRAHFMQKPKISESQHEISIATDEPQLNVKSMKDSTIVTTTVAATVVAGTDIAESLLLKESASAVSTAPTPTPTTTTTADAVTTTSSLAMPLGDSRASPNANIDNNLVRSRISLIHHQATTSMRMTVTTSNEEHHNKVTHDLQVNRSLLR